jgi:hypothetical protein
MARWRSIVGLSLVAVWLATPALACLPNPHMTDVEMACCKKMAGDCQMGTGQHPCCKTASNAPALVASIQPISDLHPDFASVAGVVIVVPLLSRSEVESEQIDLGLPPPAPPGQNSILRI